MQTGWDECLKVGHSLSHQPLPWGDPAILAELSRPSVSLDLFTLGGQKLILNCWFSPSCAQVTGGPEYGYGSVLVTLPALAGGRKCLNLGQSLTAAPRGGSDFLFIAL